jgi:hypothetical protein
VLQHGGLILQRSAVAPEILGLAELSNKQATFADFTPLWLERMAIQLGLEVSEIDPNEPPLESLAREVARTKFERLEWNLRR